MATSWPSSLPSPVVEVRAWITREPIALEDVLRHVGAPEDGASVLFLGHVRDHNEGRPVVSLSYDAYAEMAQPILARIVAEAAETLGTDRVAAVHRIGDLRIGEVSVAIAASSPHRAQAFDACRQVIDEIKRRLPVWKEEHYADATARWLPGQVPAGERHDE